MNLYAAYLNEREGAEVYETSRGFAVYRFIPPRSVYIKEIYVSPDYRRVGTASGLADDVAAIAAKKGCTEMIGSIDPLVPSADASLRVLLGYGMKLQTYHSGLLYFSKEIK